ncbi:MAG: glycosyltransferase [Firmicutes bacterium]|nr:glycosyltransferase [Bacillota bacterium]
MRAAHINLSTEGNAGETALALCETLQGAGHAALLCHALGSIPAAVPSYRIGGKLDRLQHKTHARMFDCAGFRSRRATQRLIEQLTLYKPDLVHLHSLHGYYLHVPELMAYLAKAGVPVVWTLYDSWPYTGHCTAYGMADCDRYRSGCGHCPNKRVYPKSFALDRSQTNWQQKRDAIGKLDNLTLVAPSQWMAEELHKSFLADRPLHIIPGGVDLSVFRPAGDADVESVAARYGLRRQAKRPLIISVARSWRAARGINDLMDLHEELKNEAVIAVVGLKPRQMEYLPPGMVGIPVIFGMDTLRALYTAADICVSLRYEEAQDLTLAEALACGTQIVCYGQTSLPEIVTHEIGTVVPTGRVRAVADACRALLEAPKDPLDCIARAQAFDRELVLHAYMDLYDILVLNARRKRTEGG